MCSTIVNSLAFFVFVRAWITLESMYFADEIRSTKGILPEKRVRVDAKELDMAATLIERFTTSFDHAKYKDEYRDRLLDVVKRKHRGDDVHAPPEPERNTPTAILEALRASVEAAKASMKSRTTKPTPGKRAAPRASAKVRNLLEPPQGEKPSCKPSVNAGIASRESGYLPSGRGIEKGVNDDQQTNRAALSRIHGNHRGGSRCRRRRRHLCHLGHGEHICGAYGCAEQRRRAEHLGHRSRWPSPAHDARHLDRDGPDHLLVPLVPL